MHLEFHLCIIWVVLIGRRQFPGDETLAVGRLWLHVGRAKAHIIHFLSTRGQQRLRTNYYNLQREGQSGISASKLIY